MSHHCSVGGIVAKLYYFNSKPEISQDEIIDETDVFVDMDKKMIRQNPGMSETGVFANDNAIMGEGGYDPGTLDHTQSGGMDFTTILLSCDGYNT